jgi:hypothetical protein
MDESERPELPASLRAVAYFTILCGIGTALTMIVDLFHGKLMINVAVLLIPAGFGLLRRSQGWRTFTLFMLWVGMIGFGVGFVLVLLGVGKVTMGSRIDAVFQGRSRELIAAVFAAMFVVEFWQYRVLTSPLVRRRFGLIETRDRTRDDPGTDADPDGSASGPPRGT